MTPSQTENATGLFSLRSIVARVSCTRRIGRAEGSGARAALVSLATESIVRRRLAQAADSR
jgi:hypothetical protein